MHVSKVVLVVGGTGGIGRATAVAFARQGAAVAVAGRNTAAAAETLATIRKAGGDGMSVTADVTRIDSVERMVQDVVKQFGRLDCAFNNAGWEGTAELSADISERDWLQMIDIKLNGLWRCMKFEIQQMLAQGGGTIVNMAGSWGLQGFPRYASYCAAAHGVVGLTRAAAMEYAKQGVRINAVCPGAVDAPMLDRMVGGDAAVKESFGQSIPLGRIASVEDVAEAVLWLSSDKATYVAGHALVLNGGA